MEFRLKLILIFLLFFQREVSASRLLQCLASDLITPKTHASFKPISGERTLLSKSWDLSVDPRPCLVRFQNGYQNCWAHSFVENIEHLFGTLSTDAKGKHFNEDFLSYFFFRQQMIDAAVGEKPVEDFLSSTGGTMEIAIDLVNQFGLQTKGADAYKTS